MKTIAEMKIEISNARISNAIVMPDGTCKLKIEVEMATKEQNANDDCILVEASKLSLNDTFMSHTPKTEAEKEFKALLTEVIKNGIEDFYRPAMDPSAHKEEMKIYYMRGEEPAVEPDYEWWKKAVKDSKWCFGTKDQYVAFLGVLIKMMVTKGWTCCEAWDAVCNDSKKLGRYRDSDDIECYMFLDKTGSREICGFFDLANTYKLLAEDEETGKLWVVGGSAHDRGRDNPLAHLRQTTQNGLHYCYVAWLVLKK